jgi:cobalamin biosynthetic protein CobC
MLGLERTIEHGGDLTAAMAAFPAAPHPWIDLSTGINPWAYPIEAPPASAWARLPDAAGQSALLAAAALAYGTTVDRVAAAPGSQAIIQWLPQLRAPGRVAVLSPTYGEHTRSWEAAGHRVVTPTAIERIPSDADVVVLARPNNPDGRVISLDRLRTLADDLVRKGGWLVVDEAFADAVPGISVIGRLEQVSVIVLRSFGKFYGLAGARLGFAIAESGVAALLRQAMGPWCVAGPTAAVATRALGDTAWRTAMRARLGAAAEDLDGILAAAGLEPLGGTPLFRLARTADARHLYTQLAAAGILVRRFEAQPDRLRFGLPPDAEAADRLRRALMPAAL